MMHHIELELCEDSSGLQGLVLIVLGKKVCMVGKGKVLELNCILCQRCRGQEPSPSCRQLDQHTGHKKSLWVPYISAQGLCPWERSHARSL